MLPGPRIFRSRWSAVIWAAGMVWFALTVVPFSSNHPHSAAVAAGSAGRSSAGGGGSGSDDQEARDAAKAVNALESISG